MPNIILNSYCNRNCIYCFAQKKNQGPYKQLSLDNLVKICDFLENSDIHQVNILGGEPTLHPEFNLFLSYLISRGFFITIFSNGMIRKPVLKKIKETIDEWALDYKRLKLVLNINEPKYRTQNEDRMEKTTFRTLNRHIGLSFNIFEKNCDMNFLVDLIRDFELIPRIRLGLAAPIMGRHNIFLPLEDYRFIARKIIRLSERCQKHAIDFGFDCGFPLCIFTDAEIGKLYKHMTRLQFVCDPVLDIDADLNVIYCYPLSEYQTLKLSDFKHVSEIYDHFNGCLKEDDKRKGIFPECLDCQYRLRGRCAGGCKGHYLVKSESKPEASCHEAVK
jgi:MoaA/NifB/PqqE/SkfB family radical SAM enzyme